MVDGRRCVRLWCLSVVCLCAHLSVRLLQVATKIKSMLNVVARNFADVGVRQVDECGLGPVLEVSTQLQDPAGPRSISVL